MFEIKMKQQEGKNPFQVEIYNGEKNVYSKPFADYFEALKFRSQVFDFLEKLELNVLMEH